jgi:eukaryotic-like serine/threonine-protein kinase
MRAATVAGRFEIERLAGAGAMGSVYRARDLVTGGPVAVKVVRRPSHEAALRFEREARVLARLSHPAIVGYIDHGRTEEDMFLVMEWLEGESLSERLSQRGLSPAESVAMGRRLASALGFAHAAGVVHRDVKPSNVFLPHGRVEAAMLVDFGIAHLVARDTDITMTGAMVGTPAFVSPEQARGERSLDARSDVFSLGAVLYKCLTGRPPFVSDDVYDLLVRVIRDPIAPPSALRPGLPEDLDRLVARMLSKAPDDRPKDGAAVVKELDALAPIVGSLPPPRARGPILAEGDRRILSLVAVAARGLDPAAIEEIAARHRGRVRQVHEAVHVVSLGETPQAAADGRATVERSFAPTDVASRAARCALALSAAAPGARIAVASGRFAGEDSFPHALVEGALELTSVDPGGSIRVDDMTASLLDARFEVTRDGARLSLASAATPRPATRCSAARRRASVASRRSSPSRRRSRRRSTSRSPARCSCSARRAWARAASAPSCSGGSGSAAPGPPCGAARPTRWASSPRSR